MIGGDDEAAACGIVFQDALESILASRHSVSLFEKNHLEWSIRHGLHECEDLRPNRVDRAFFGGIDVKKIPILDAQGSKKNACQGGLSSSRRAVDKQMRDLAVSNPTNYLIARFRVSEYVVIYTNRTVFLNPKIRLHKKTSFECPRDMGFRLPVSRDAGNG
jgi:hypothetical protein